MLFRLVSYVGAVLRRVEHHRGDVVEGVHHPVGALGQPPAGAVPLLEGVGRHVAADAPLGVPERPDESAVPSLGRLDRHALILGHVVEKVAQFLSRAQRALPPSAPGNTVFSAFSC